MLTPFLYINTNAHDKMKLRGDKHASMVYIISSKDSISR